MDDTSTGSADHLSLDAPHRELLDELLDKWSLQVLDRLCEQPHRFNDLRRAIPAIGQKSLTATLRRLERNGMIERVVLDVRPLAVEYRIAAVGSTLSELVDAMLGWARRNLGRVEEARARYDSHRAVSSRRPLPVQVGQVEDEAIAHVVLP